MKQKARGKFSNDVKMLSPSRDSVHLQELERTVI